MHIMLCLLAMCMNENVHVRCALWKPWAGRAPVTRPLTRHVPIGLGAGGFATPSFSRLSGEDVARQEGL